MCFFVHVGLIWETSFECMTVLPIRFSVFFRFSELIMLSMATEAPNSVNREMPNVILFSINQRLNDGNKDFPEMRASLTLPSTWSETIPFEILTVESKLF